MARSNRIRHRVAHPRPATLAPNPAPGDLHLVQAFINTLDAESTHDQLTGPEALSSWLSSRGLLPTDTELTDDDWRHALAARKGLRAILWSHNSQPLNRAAIKHMNHAIARSRPLIRFDRDGEMGFESPDGGWHGALSRLLSICHEAMVEKDQWQRFKACWNPKCQCAFYDVSSNQSGKWCSARRCGNRAHTRTYRSRKS